MESFILNLANGWTIVDLSIMFILLLVAYWQYKKVQAKENLLKFADIEREQSREERIVAEKELKIAYGRIEAFKVGNGVLLNSNYSLIESRDYWKNRALHKKHTSKKVVDSDNWKCINQHYLNFNNGSTYKKDLSQTPTSNSLLFLICDDNKPYLVEKKYFHPIN